MTSTLHAACYLRYTTNLCVIRCLDGRTLAYHIQVLEPSHGAQVLNFEPHAALARATFQDGKEMAIDCGSG